MNESAGQILIGAVGVLISVATVVGAWVFGVQGKLATILERLDSVKENLDKQEQEAEQHREEHVRLWQTLDKHAQRITRVETERNKQWPGA